MGHFTRSTRLLDEVRNMRLMDDSIPIGQKHCQRLTEDVRPSISKYFLGPVVPFDDVVLGVDGHDCIGGRRNDSAIFRFGRLRRAFGEVLADEISYADAQFFDGKWFREE